MISRRWILSFLSMVVMLNVVRCSSVCQLGSGDRYRRGLTSNTRKSHVKRDTEPDPSDPCYDFVYGDPEKLVFCSPGYPRTNYTKSIECFRVLEAPHNHLVRLDFRDRFKLEDDCKNDYLEVRDGPHGFNQLKDAYCGSAFPPPITSSDRHLWIHFRSDDTLEYEGFKAVYEFIPRSEHWTTPEIRPCVMNMTGESGVLSNKNISEDILNFVRQHNMAIDCLWNITVREGWKIQLTFLDFYLEKPNECDKNFLDVFSNKTDIPSREKNFCGSIADAVNSKGNVMYVRFFATPNANKSSFDSLFTAYRESKDGSCGVGEFDCEDSCISDTLVCNQELNCRYQWDEEVCNSESPMLGESHIIIIMVIFSLILSGMCFTFIFNCVKKLIRDHHAIQEYIRESREQQLNELGKQEQFEKKVTKLSLSRSNSTQSSDSQRFAAANAMPNTPCYVPGGELLPIMIRSEHTGVGVGTNGDTYNQTTHPYDNESTPQPEMCDSACQTRESLFHPHGSEHSTPIHSIHSSTNSKPSPPAPFSTFGYKKENKFRAEAKIEVEKIDQKSKYDDKRRPYSVQTTKSAPDVIVTH